MILDRFRLDGRVALVTGGNRGLGQAYAVALAEAGADVALLGRSDPEQTRERIAALGRRVVHLPGDVLADVQQRLRDEADFEVDPHHFALVGRCAACRD